MVVLPTVDQFPSLAQTIKYLKTDIRQCVWYLPDKERCCFVQLTLEDNQRALQVLIKLRNAFNAKASPLEELENLAEACCCARHHRNKMYASGLAQKLANRWEHELRKAWGFPDHQQTLPDVKTEDVKIRKRNTFALHQVNPGQTLVSSLLSDLKTGAKTEGSLYFYSLEAVDFKGMIKIGFTGNTIQSRLNAWAECGYGYPMLRGDCSHVRHPERVELLTHFELVDCWHAQRWCEYHERAHIEWFKVDSERALKVAGFWCQWMKYANPYDRRGRLKALWVGHINFLVEHDNPITGKAMAQIQRIEEGSDEINGFIDDTLLRMGQGIAVKREEVEEE